MPAPNKYPAEKYYLLKAESLCAELLANGVTFDHLVLQRNGSFGKSYRNDVEEVNGHPDERGPYVISLNRDSIYDLLPEGFFHQTRGGSNTASVSAMVGEYKRYREEEKQARKFFQPIEQELFRYATFVEEFERDTRFGFLNGKLSEDFYHFWNIDRHLPEGPASILLLIMPWLKQIKGDYRLTAKAMSMTLSREVDVCCTVTTEESAVTQHFLLGQDLSLGSETICGNVVHEPIEQWIFTLKDIGVDEMARYTDNGDYGKFLQRFVELFIPLEVEAVFEYHYSELPEGQQQEQILGYGYYL